MGYDGSRLACIRVRSVVKRRIVLARDVYCMSRMPLLVVLDHFKDQ